MNAKPGTYALLLRSSEHRFVPIGRWGKLEIQSGYYIYVGSAFGPGGVPARVSRHCRTIKAKHWHIDYLREFTIPAAVWYSHSKMRLEHRWAAALAKMKEMHPVNGFGCSDCKCKAHLFFSFQEPDLTVIAKRLRACFQILPAENRL